MTVVVHLVEWIGDKAMVLCGAQSPEKYVTHPYERSVTCSKCREVLRERYDS